MVCGYLASGTHVGQTRCYHRRVNDHAMSRQTQMARRGAARVAASAAAGNYAGRWGHPTVLSIPPITPGPVRCGYQQVVDPRLTAFC
jgi:hypothetical protein